MLDSSEDWGKARGLSVRSLGKRDAVGKVVTESNGPHGKLEVWGHQWGDPGRNGKRSRYMGKKGVRNGGEDAEKQRAKGGRSIQFRPPTPCMITGK